MTEKQEEVFTIEDLKDGTPALLNNTKQINKLNIKKLLENIGFLLNKHYQRENIKAETFYKNMKIFCLMQNLYFSSIMVMIIHIAVVLVIIKLM